VNSAYLIAGIISIVAVLAWIGLLIWGASEDGRSENGVSPRSEH